MVDGKLSGREWWKIELILLGVVVIECHKDLTFY